MNRRNFFGKTLLSAGGILTANLAQSTPQPFAMKTEQIKEPKTIFFDVNETLLDLAPLKESVAKVLDGHKELISPWFTTMLHYSLVATVGDQYRDFAEIGAATLRMVAANNGISLSEDEAREALKPILSLPAHPEVPEALARLKEGGYTLVTLTNSSNKGVEAQMTNSGLKKYFHKLLSIEDLGMYKPHRHVYNWAARKMKVEPEESLMIAAHGWDVAGAAWAGWQTAFISRPGQQLYPLAKKPEIVAPTLSPIVEELLAIKK